MKLKILKKKIRRLEARLQDGPKKLAKLKRKLEAAVKADAAKARKKAALRAAATRQAAKSPQRTQAKSRSKAKPQVKPASEKRTTPAKKVKRKLNLSPERRAQLSAAMKARWDAKRAVLQGNPQDTSADRRSRFYAGSGSDDALGRVRQRSLT